MGLLAACTLAVFSNIVPCLSVGFSSTLQYRLVVSLNIKVLGSQHTETLGVELVRQLFLAANMHYIPVP